MKKLFLPFLAILLISFHAAGQTLNEKTLLWEISGKDLSRPSYLYGTVHLMCPQDLQVSAVVKEKFNATQALFLEIKTDDPNMMAQMMAGLKMKDSSTLKSLLGQQHFDSLSTIFKTSTGIPLEMLNTAKPILVISMVYPSLLGCIPDSWEKTFETMAKPNNMPISGLETLADQMSALENIPYQMQANMLQKMMYNLDSSKLIFTNLLAAYNNKDLQGLYNMTTGDADFGPYEGALLIKRNQNWIPVMKEQAKKAPTFFAVGAAHLAGNEGVINLLRKEGYNVKPIMY